jgi:enoyl-CoA hydratase/carnithine racemase
MLQIITLNSTKNKNALSTSVLQSIKDQLLAAWQNPKVKAIWIESVSSDFFSAGGDVKQLHSAIESQQLELCNEFFTVEYSTDYLIHIFKKPIITWVDGIVFGGGLGLIQGASHKIFSPSAIASMPEVLIGLFPDVGASYFLQKLPQNWKTAVSEKARRLTANECHSLGLCDYLIDIDKAHVLKKLQNLNWGKTNSENHILIEKLLSPISRSITKVTYIENADEKSNEAYACPSSVEFTRGQLKAGIGKSVRRAFEMEWQYAYHFCRSHNFKEGVRALLVDKDRKPQWQEENIDVFFAPVTENCFEEFKKVLDTLDTL